MSTPALLGGQAAFPEGLPLVRPTVADSATMTADIQAVLESGTLTNGPRVRELETRVRARLGVGHVVAVSSCTTGLMLTYQALGVTGGTRVILPSFTFAASAHAVSWVGAEVDFAEVTAERASLDVADLAKRLDEGPPVSAVSATHVYGHPAEVEAIDELAAARDIPVVYDAAHALGSTRAGRAVGGFGRAEVFSLSPTKVVVAGEGGLVATNDDDLAATLRLGRDYGNPGDYDCRFAGLNGRMSEVHAVMALHSLSCLDDHLAARAHLADRFAAAVEGLPGIRVVRPDAGDVSTYKDLTVMIEPDRFGLSAAELQTSLKSEGIDSRRYYAPPIHQQTAHAGSWRAPRPLPVTERLAASVLSPPLWSHMVDAQIEAVADAIGRLHAHAPRISALLRSAP